MKVAEVVAEFRRGSAPRPSRLAAGEPGRRCHAASGPEAAPQLVWLCVHPSEQRFAVRFAASLRGWQHEQGARRTGLGADA